MPFLRNLKIIFDHLLQTYRSYGAKILISTEPINIENIGKMQIDIFYSDFT